VALLLEANVAVSLANYGPDVAYVTVLPAFKSGVKLAQFSDKLVKASRFLFVGRVRIGSPLGNHRRIAFGSVQGIAGDDSKALRVNPFLQNLDVPPIKPNVLNTKAGLPFCWGNPSTKV
jgi:hypothetical protein